MIMKTNVIPPIALDKNEVSTFMFEKTEHIYDFIKSIEYFVKSRTKNSEFPLILMDEKFQEINKKEIYPIIMDCGKFDLKDEKSFKDGIVKTFEKLVFENSSVHEYFYEFQKTLDILVNNLEINKPKYTLELQADTFNIKNLLKLVDSDFHRNGRELKHHELRESYFDIVTSMNVDKKRIVLFVIYPESYLGSDEIKVFMNYLKQLNAVTVVITNDFRIIKETKINFLNLVKKNGVLYDILGLSSELELFGLVRQDLSTAISIQLSYLDFAGNEILVNDKFKSFLDN